MSGAGFLGRRPGTGPRGAATGVINRIISSDDLLAPGGGATEGDKRMETKNGWPELSARNAEQYKVPADSAPNAAKAMVKSI